MPKAVYVVSDVRENAVRPMALEIARQVLQWTGLEKETQIIYAGDTEEAFQPGSTIETQQQFNEFDARTRWTMKVEERTISDFVLTESVDYIDNPFIYRDDQTWTYMRPAYNQVEFVFNVTNKFTDRNHARNWRNDLRARVSANRTEVQLLKASYSYLIPFECIEIAAQIHKMREAVEPYGETFDQYWNKSITPKATVLSDQVGKNTGWAISETQPNIPGFFDFFEEPEEGQKGNDNSSWDVTFTFTARVHVPAAVFVQYPLMVHNQIVPKEFRRTKGKPDRGDVAKEYSLVTANMNQFSRLFETKKMVLPGIQLPEIDEWFANPLSIPPHTLRVLTLMTKLDTVNPKMLLDFTEFSSEYHIDPDVLEFMKGEAPWLNLQRQSIVNVMVFKGDMPMHENAFSVTPELKVMLRDTPSFRDQFHVRLALWQRPRLLPPDAKKRMRNHCNASLKLLTALNPNIMSLNPSCTIQDYMPDATYNALLEKIDREFDTFWNGKFVQFNTVMQSVINARKIQDAPR